MNEPVRPSPSPSASAGQLLSSAREEWGLSVAEVATCLNLSSATITALEQDIYDHLPGSTFARGYLRAYAKLLKLDQEKIMDCIDLESEQVNEIPATKTALRSTRHRTWSKKRGGFLISVLLATGILAGLTWYALYRLPDLDMYKVQDVFNLPAPGASDDEANPIPLQESG